MQRSQTFLNFELIPIEKKAKSITLKESVPFVMTGATVATVRYVPHHAEVTVILKCKL
ncbi:MAG: hypothetical protein ABSE82_10680 [Nitrososphaerales archaeon]